MTWIPLSLKYSCKSFLQCFYAFFPAFYNELWQHHAMSYTWHNFCDFFHCFLYKLFSPVIWKEHICFTMMSLVIFFNTSKHIWIDVHLSASRIKQILSISSHGKWDHSDSFRVSFPMFSSAVTPKSSRSSMRLSRLSPFPRLSSALKAGEKWIQCESFPKRLKWCFVWK